MVKTKIGITRPKFETLRFTIRSMPGVSMIMNHLSDETKAIIEGDQTGENKSGRKHKIVEEIFEQKKYLTEDGKLGVAGLAVKAAMVAAAKITGEAMTDMRKGIWVIGDVVPFKSHSEPVIKKDCLAINGRGRNFTVRCEIKEWVLSVAIMFNANFISGSQIATLLELAGFHCGLYDFRPNGRNCSGNHGMFTLDQKAEMIESGQFLHADTSSQKSKSQKMKKEKVKV